MQKPFLLLRTAFTKLWTNKLLVSFFGFWILYFALFWSNAVAFDAQGNFIANHVNIWGDWAAHFTMATALQYRGLFIGSPFLLGARFSYPFVADFVSAVLLQIGVPLIPAFVFPSFFFCLFLLLSLFLFYKRIFKSTNISLVAISLFLCNGGVGFAYFLQDVATSNHPLLTLLNPPHEYTRFDAMGIKWVSVIDSMLIPQRSFALGFGVAVLALTIIYKLFFQIPIKTSKHAFSWKRVHALILPGLLFGVLPLLHTHSFLACFVFLSWWAVVDILSIKNWPKRLRRIFEWGVVATTTSLIALPLLNIFFIENISHGFFRWYPGWMSRDFAQSWLFFTWQNWGITLLTTFAGFTLLLRVPKTRKTAVLLLPGVFLFTVANLFLFQPWSWDNTKIFVWFLLVSSGTSAYLLAKLTDWKITTRAWRALKNAIVCLIFFCLIASGALDAYRVLRVDLHANQMYSAEEFVLANWVKSNTPVDSIWLTGYPHNHWLFNLTGRQSVMTYPGWLWTQGYDYLQTQRDIGDIYLGRSNAVKLLEKYRVQYVIIGPIERRDLKANTPYFSKNFSMIYQSPSTLIFDVTKK